MTVISALKIPGSIFYSLHNIYNGPATKATEATEEATTAVTQAAAEATEEAAQADPQAAAQVNYSPLQPITAATGLKDLR